MRRLGSWTARDDKGRSGALVGRGVEGAEWSAGESGSVVMITGGGLLRDMVELGSWEEAGRKEERRKAYM